MTRYFNTSGPNNPEEHYTLQRPQLVEKGLDLIAKKRYFTIWAPRQSGKSTYFLLLKTQLEKLNYKVIHINLENFLNASLKTFSAALTREFSRVDIKLPALNNMGDFSNFLHEITDTKIVFIVDEIEGLNPELFGQFLHSIRNLYHARDIHALKSVVLVGVSNIVGVVEDHASPFNIADTIQVPYFTKGETFSLLEQHEKETGQLFEPQVKEKISNITANQPGLVNGFAKELVERSSDYKPITYSSYLEVEHWYLYQAIDKNISSIINKARKYRLFLEQLLFTEATIPFDIDREAIKYLHTQGIIQADKHHNVHFWVPLYKKRLYKAFYPYTNGEANNIGKELWINEFLTEEGKLNFDLLIERYKEYVQRRSFKYFREKDEHGKYISMKEAALVYSFETYIQAFLQEAKGKSYLEPHTGLGRSDLIIFLNNQEYIIEFKVYSGVSKFEKGKKQLAYYCQKMGLVEGIYLVFVPNISRLPQPIKAGIDHIEGVVITTYLVKYDEEKDF